MDINEVNEYGDFSDIHQRSFKLIVYQSKLLLLIYEHWRRLVTINKLWKSPRMMTLLS